MYEEKIKMATILYLIGMLVYVVWFFARNGGIKGYKESIREISTRYGIQERIVLVMAIVIDTFLIGAWPFAMHLGIKDRLKKTEES